MLNIEDSILVVVDVQEKLTGLMHEHTALCHNIGRIIKVAEILRIPILWTEQAPDKIGSTVEPISNLLFPLVKPIAKKSFSCWACQDFTHQLQSSKRRQVILVGIETHVCIYQTARDLQIHGFEVQVVADAVSSRHLSNKEIAIARMRQENIIITCAESVICEFIKTAEHPQFRNIMAYLKQ